MTLEGFNRAFMNIKVQLICEKNCGAINPVLPLWKAQQLFEMNKLLCCRCSAPLAKL